MKVAVGIYSEAVLKDAKDKYIVQGGGKTGEHIVSRGGRLRGSIKYKISDSGDVTQIVFGSNVKYAPVHEYGFSGTQNVSPFTRRVKSRNVFAKIEGKRKRIAVGIGTVRAFTRKMNIRARPYIKPAIIDNFPAFRENISKILGDYPSG